MRWALLLISTVCAVGAHSPNHHNHHQHQHPVYSKDIPPQHVIQNAPAYKTFNPPHRDSRSNAPNKSPQNAPQLLASGSTPVLVLKKDVTRPVLASAVQPPAEKRSSNTEQKPNQLPTVIMERPPPPKSQEKPKETRSFEEEEEVSEEAQQASAERRMFFDHMNAQSAAAQQVAGPRPSKPQPKIVSQASNVQTHRQDHEEHEQRRAAATYQGALPFEYPPQNNYVVGPVKTPVRYQQGVQGQRHHQQHHGQHHVPQHHGERHHGQQQPHHGKPRPRPQRPLEPGSASEELLSEEEEEQTPDRLQELLAKSKFTCDGKKDGYYSDDTVNCEVFHYCQANAKHSWACPDSFVFHQIHLICVPPSSDNICKQSSNFHFVNEYLYRPINEKEHESTNASLKYADRYFPDSVQGAGDVALPYHNEQESEEDYKPHHQQHAQIPQQRPRPQQHHQQQQYNPYAQQPQQHHQRPAQYPQGFSPSLQYNPKQQRPQQVYSQRVGTSGPSPKGQKPNVFYSPDSVNIPLNQRRPVPNNFKPSPQAPQNLKHHHHDQYEY